MKRTYFLEELYPFQDSALRVLAGVETDFYLTGGTAASRGYLPDIWGFCCGRGLSIRRALEGAPGKAAGLFPVDIGRILLNATREDWELVRWTDAPEPDSFLSDLRGLGEDLLLLGQQEDADE